MKPLHKKEVKLLRSYTLRGTDTMNRVAIREGENTVTARCHIKKLKKGHLLYLSHRRGHGPKAGRIYKPTPLGVALSFLAGPETDADKIAETCGEATPYVIRNWQKARDLGITQQLKESLHRVTQRHVEFFQNGVEKRFNWAPPFFFESFDTCVIQDLLRTPDAPDAEIAALVSGDPTYSQIYYDWITFENGITSNRVQHYEAMHRAQGT